MADWLTWGDTITGGALTADVVTRIDHESESEVTTHPIETGSEISDHVIHKPKRVTFEFSQSALPLRSEELEWSQVGINPAPNRFQPTGLLAVSTAAERALKAIGSAIGLVSGGELQIWALTAKEEKDRIHALHDQLLKLQKDAELVSFQYSGLVLSDYVITSVRYSRQRPGGMVRFTIDAQEVATVATATSTLGSLADAIPGALRLLPSLPFGKKGVEEVEADVIDHSLLVDSTLEGIL